MSESSVLVLEFNELTPRRMYQWMNAGLLPGFRRLHEEASCFITDAEESGDRLEPWVQWVTAHSGLSSTEHGILDLDDGHKLRQPRIWDTASAAGRRVWICGSMNAGRHGESLNGAIVPDPWASRLEPEPKEEFDAFFKLISSYVKEYASNSVGLGAMDYVRFGQFMLTHGLSRKTVQKTINQLLSERGGRYKWKRAMILDRLLWDLFRSEWRKRQPHLATLFLNSTAHLQHYHWRNMEPESFRIQPGADEQAEYGDAILDGYRAMDEIVCEAFELIEGTDTSLVLLTALSQQPLTRYEADGGKQVFKPFDALELYRFAGGHDPVRYAPVMAEEYHLFFDDEIAAERGRAALAGLRLDGGEALMRIRRDGNELFVSCAIITRPHDDALIQGASGRSARRFHETFHPVGELKSGGHHPDGLFWIRPARHQAGTGQSGSAQAGQGEAAPGEAGRVSLRQVAPTLAELAGVPADALERAYALPPLAHAGSVRQTSPDRSERVPAFH